MNDRTLIIDTATAACSVALVGGEAVIACAHEVVGRGHAERLLPMIAELPEGGRATRVLVDCGPGSFTGVRVGIAAARGLGLGWGVPVAGFTSVLLLAASAMAVRPGEPIMVAMEGGHGELFVQPFAADLTPLAPLASLTPEAALAALAGRRVVGSGARWLAELDGALDLADALPVAADAVLLPAGATALPPRPIYGRAPDARLPAAAVPA
jgi:tRNA threonylcarbamoyladenosine biosynthesis protein TsaB